MTVVGANRAVCPHCESIETDRAVQATDVAYSCTACGYEWSAPRLTVKRDRRSAVLDRRSKRRGGRRASDKSAG
jgi:uncharacterized Zn finger protein